MLSGLGQFFLQFLYGGADNDDISGGDGDDSIDGGTGDDTIDGGAGDDVFVGSTGNDTYTGGDGADTFNFQSDVNRFDDIVITDFNVDEDTLELEADNLNGASLAEFAVETSIDGVDGVLITYAGVGAGSIFVQGVTIGDLADALDTF